jgi:GNAT superfamily N-acetyltransferase
MNQEDLRDTAVGAFNNLLRERGRTFPNSVVRDGEGVDITWSGTKIRYLNAAVRVHEAKTASQLEDSLRYAKRQFDELDNHRIGGKFVFELSSLLEQGISEENIKETIMKYELEVEFLTTMVRCGAVFENIDYKGLKIAKVETAGQLAQVCRVFDPEDTTDWSYPTDHWRSLYSFLGIVDGKVVTTATAQLYQGKVFLSTVGTHPDHRKRGYASAISQIALQSAIHASGSQVGLLHATQMSKSVYEKIGFKKIGTMGIATYKPQGAM